MPPSTTRSSRNASTITTAPNSAYWTRVLEQAGRRVSNGLSPFTPSQVNRAQDFTTGPLGGYPSDETLRNLGVRFFAAIGGFPVHYSTDGIPEVNYSAPGTRQVGTDSNGYGITGRPSGQRINRARRILNAINVRTRKLARNVPGELLH